LTATSLRPASLRLATTFDPMNPAPPVTNNIDALTGLRRTRADSRSFAPVQRHEQHWAAFSANLGSMRAPHEMNFNS
jgi:hypothetical protein